ncbi:MAG: hypothetical protein HKN41_13395 [Ilumatobacter sp.]|nr:hypothetical protein [Ilumatobacter sp.]
MDVRRATLLAAIPLAIVVSAIAASIAVVLELLGDVSRPSLLLSVTLVGFVTSWVRSGRTAEALRPHRPALVRVDRPGR